MYTFLLNLHQFDGAEGGAEGAGAPEGADLANQQADLDAEFEELIGGKYKEQYGKRVKDAVDARFKTNDAKIKSMQADNDEYKKAKPIMELLYQKHGVKTVDELKSAIEEDDTYWEEQAYKRGIPVDEYKRFYKLEKENEELRRSEEERVGRERANERIGKWVQQGETLKQTFPSFDLRMEWESNETFRQILDATNNVKVAFYTAHMDEIDQAKTSLISKEAEKRIAQSVQAGKARPSESGSRPQTPMTSNVDISKMTNEQMDEYIRRAKAGEKISFR